MKDRSGRIIYVGKAKILPKRVATYFQKSGLSPRIALLVSHIASFDYVVTATEKEALILENSLIKKHHPPYNVSLRDDKTYPSLRLSLKDPFPFLEIVRKPVKDGSVIFGPFSSVGSFRETVRLVSRLFQLRKCRRPEVKKTDRPCLNYQMGRCLGPCRPEISEEEYRTAVSEVRLFFKGQSGEIRRSLVKSMREASDRFDFEAAAKIRDRLTDLDRTLEKQIVSLAGGGDRDVWALAGRDGLWQAAVLIIRDGVVFGCQPVWAESELSDQEILTSLVSQYYGQGHFLPPEIWLPESTPQKERETLAGWLAALGQVKVTRAKGEDGQKIQAMAEENARISLEERLQKIVTSRGVLAELMARLNLETVPRRVECLDLAHIQGQAFTGGLVYMEDGELKKEGYRRFRIKSAKPGDDYGGLREVIKRRFAPGKDQEKWAWPDLLLLDGGRGQLAAAEAAFAELGLTPPPLAGIAKDRPNRGPDRIFRPGRKNPSDLKPGSAGLLLLARLRDEAHRWCRSYHHLLRSKDMLQSLFDGLKQLGPVRQKALVQRFVSLEELARASDEEILASAPLSAGTLAELRKRLARLLAGRPGCGPEMPGPLEEGSEGEELEAGIQPAEIGPLGDGSENEEPETGIQPAEIGPLRDGSEDEEPETGIQPAGSGP
jgi:excinuclease ABC subunit C